MALKELKEYGLKLKDLKAAIKDLHDAEILDKKLKVVGIKGVDVLTNFINALHALPEETFKEIPEKAPIATEFYDGLKQNVFDDLEEDDGNEDKKPEKKSSKKSEKKSDKKAGKKSDKKEDSKEDEVTSDCPTFKKGWNPKEKDCKACKKDTPKEYEACKVAVKEAKRLKKIEKLKKTPRKRTRYGNTPNTMTGLIDDMIWEGYTLEKMVKMLKKRFGRDEDKAIPRIKGHINRMIKDGSITLEDREDGVFKAVNEFKEGVDTENYATTL